jgi:hypothetical protein
MAGAGGHRHAAAPHQAADAIGGGLVDLEGYRRTLDLDRLVLGAGGWRRQAGAGGDEEAEACERPVNE